MNKRLAVIVGVIAIVVLVGGVVLYAGSDTGNDAANTAANATQDQTANDPNQSSEASQAENAVTISNFAFGPKQITVKVGTTVTWTNQDSVKHDIKMENGSSEGPSSELLAKGESYSYTFDRAGTYNYLCTPHPYMKGTVTVTE